MQNSSDAGIRRGLLLTLFLLGLATFLVLVPLQFESEVAAKGKGLFEQTTSNDPLLPNYDIRLNRKTEDIESYFSSVRESIARNASSVADVRDAFVRGEDALRTKLPSVKFEYNEDIRTPEVITPDVWKERAEYLTAPSTTKRSEILRNFVRENNELIGVSDEQAASLRVTADYTNPNGYMSFAHLERDIMGDRTLVMTAYLRASA